MQRFVESNRRRGFTLMELLVVLAILVLLMAMVAPRVLKFLGKSDISVTISQIGNLKKSLDLYTADCRKYPTTEQGLQALISPPAMGETGTAVRGWDGPYLDGDAVPLDPWGLPYGYAFPPTRGRGPGPDIWSCGPDSMDGTEDDLCSWTQSASGSGERGMDDPLGQDPMGQDPMGQNPLGTDPMGGQLGPGSVPGMQPPGQGGFPPVGGTQPGMQPGGMPPGGMPPLGGGTGPLGGGTGPSPPGSGPMPQPRSNNF